MQNYILMYKDEKVVEVIGYQVNVLKLSRLPIPLRNRNPLSASDILDWAFNRIIDNNRVAYDNLISAYKSNGLKIDIIFETTHLASLKDSYWFKELRDKKTWKDVNLFTNKFDEWMTYRALLDINSTTQPRSVTPELTTTGKSQKAWIRFSDGIYLLKVGRYELTASAILDTLGVNHIRYEEVTPTELMKYVPSVLAAGFFNKLESEKLVKCKCFTNPDISYVTWDEFTEYFGEKAAYKRLFDNKEDFKKYCTMLVADYLMNNTERYQENWGWLLNNDKDSIQLAPMINFDCSFSEVAGAMSKTTYRQLTLEDAAKYAVKSVNLNFDAVLRMKKPEELSNGQWEAVKERVKILMNAQKCKSRTKNQEDEYRCLVEPTSLFN